MYSRLASFNLSGATALIWLATLTSAVAQIIPDGTLGSENSRVVPQGEINGVTVERIDGGAIRGTNLLHSFQDFNIPEGRGAYFNNPAGITNIFSRVTGNNPSQIFGTLGVLGNANLFLMNPHGLIFGPNARLDLRGSFLATTADSFVFNDGLEFSASNPQIPLLTVNIPIGLRFRDNPGSIVNQSKAVGQVDSLALALLIPDVNNIGLAVQPGQTLALIGGDIQLQGGNLTASTGQILLGSVASPGFVGFIPTLLGLTLNYEDIQNFGNIQLSNEALINTSGIGGGRVEMTGNNVTLTGSRIFAVTVGNLDGRGIDIRANTFRAGEGTQISTFTFAEGMGGSFNLNATDSVEFSGLGVASFQEFLSRIIATGTIPFFDSNVVLATGGIGTGKAGNLTINTGRLLLRDGAGVGSVTFGAGEGGDIMLRANTVEIVGSGINSGTFAGSTGNGGNIAIDTGRLTVRDGSVVTALTLSEGASGNMTIKASESVEALRTPDGAVFLNLISTTAARGSGKAGDLTIDTKRLIVTDGAAIDSSSGAFIGQTLLFSEAGPGGNVTVRASESVELSGISGNIVNRGRQVAGISAVTTTNSNGGEVRISTPKLVVRDGAAISTNSFLGQGDAGNITIDAQEIEVSGGANNGQFVSRIQAFAGRIFGAPNPDDNGNAGSLTLRTNRLMVRDGATVTALSFTGGQAGSITVDANAIALDKGGSIDATTGFGGGGNITLQARDIQLRRGSRITTDAGTSNGGQITINSDILLAFPTENSDITANAATGAGGRVNINASNIFGATAITREQIRNQLGLTDAEFAALSVNPTTLLNTSDIAAISQAAGPSLQGTVAFSTSGINPAQGLVQLPQTVVDPATLIAANPCREGGESEFVVTGRGGLPSTPAELLGDEGVRVGWSELPIPSLAHNQRMDSSIVEESRKRSTSGAARIPAQGWIINDKGEVTLTAYNPAGITPQRSPKISVICPSR